MRNQNLKTQKSNLAIQSKKDAKKMKKSSSNDAKEDPKDAKLNKFSNKCE